MSEKDNMFEGIGETIEVEIENKEALDELFNEVNKENLEIKKRFAEGTYTEDDLLNHLPHFGIGTKDKIELYLVESKYFEDLANRYINLKEIEQSHKEENGKLRVELEQKKMNDKEKEIIESYRNLVKETGVDTGWVVCNPAIMWSKYFISKDKIREEIDHLSKNIKDIENITILKKKTLKEQAEIELYKYAICVLTRLLEGEK